MTSPMISCSSFLGTSRACRSCSASKLRHISQGFHLPLEKGFHDQLFLLINQLGPGQVRFDKAVIDLLLPPGIPWPR